MSIEVKVPALPESVSDATVATWHKEAGDKVSRDENLVDLETDKVMLEVPAPEDGILKKIVKEAGDTVNADEVIAIIEAGQGGDKEEEQKESAEEKGEDKKKTEEEDKDDDAEQKQEKDKKEEKEKEKAEEDEEPRVSPAARRLAEEEGADLSAIEGTGRGGLIIKGDVQDYLASEDEKEKDTEKEEKARKEEKTEAKKPDSRPSEDERGEKRVPMSRIRARIAERMVEAQSTAAMLTSFNEVNLKAVMDIRKQYKEKFEKEHGVKLGLMSFFVRAACEALKKHPIINASVEDNDIVYHQYYDVGIAVSTDRGLVVPVLRDADRMTLAEIEKQIADYARKAREGGLTLEDLQGGTFTITNGGVFGSLISTPILNPPQSAILGMHAIKERPVVEDGEIVVRPMMYIALTYDHRIIDGRDAVLFLVAIKELLEDPSRILLNL